MDVLSLTLPEEVCFAIPRELEYECAGNLVRFELSTASEEILYIKWDAGTIAIASCGANFVFEREVVAELVVRTSELNRGCRYGTVRLGLKHEEQGRIEVIFLAASEPLQPSFFELIEKLRGLPLPMTIIKAPSELLNEPIPNLEYRRHRWKPKKEKIRFNLTQVMVSTAYFGCAFGCWSPFQWAITKPAKPLLAFLFFFAMPTLVGMGVGNLFGRAWLGGAVGFVLIATLVAVANL